MARRRLDEASKLRGSGGSNRAARSEAQRASWQQASRRTPKGDALWDSGGEDEGRSIGQVPAPAGGLAQGVPGDAADQALAGPGEAGELAGGVVDVLQGLPAGVGGAGEQALGVVAVADAAGVAVDQALGFGGDAAQLVPLVGGGAAGGEEFKRAPDGEPGHW